MSDHVIAENDNLEIEIMNGYFREQFEIDLKHDPKQWWQVIDRTTGETVPVSNWDFNEKTEKVIIKKVNKWHDYTVNFLVYQIWDPTQMYNHITNNWRDKPHEMPYDARNPEARKQMITFLTKWLDEHPQTDVVRFTTFFYHFTLCFNEFAKEKFVDWFGYSSSVSPIAFEEFEKKKGYKLLPEDIVDEGYYNSPFRIPSRQYLDWLDFQQQFVSELAKECVDLAHNAGKEAMMFLGDNWIGTEPYGDYFKNIGIDAVVGSVGNGATLRMISDIPGVKYTEGRFLPYFFPDVFNPNGNPVKEANENWLQARRAILRKPIDRMGYGGYLNLALDFPEFVDRVEEICNEFREIHDHINGEKPLTAPFKVAILNCWGKLRTWQTNQVAHALWYKQIYSYVGVIEALSGMAVDIEFINFDDVNLEISKDIGVIINAGDAYTAWSGGHNWVDKKVVEAIREWVHNGGAFIGVGEPTAFEHQGKYFQLSDVLGVNKEIGYSLSTRKYHQLYDEKHFIMEDVTSKIDFGEGMKNIYGIGNNTKILSMEQGDVQLAINTFGKGRAVYFSGLPYNPQNARLLLRAIYWSVGKEDEFKKWCTSNPNTECAVYPKSGKFAVINNTNIEQETFVYKNDGNIIIMTLNPMEIIWNAI
jgi:1,3-beta-galactosyl-N-acetylhexosamine phosphorylase